MKPWLPRRLHFGHYDRLMRELDAEDVVSFRNLVRMDPVMFRGVLQRVGPRIEKYDTCYRKSINPGCRLTITLHFLATHTISVIIRQTCEAIFVEYGDKVLQCPRTSDARKQVAGSNPSITTARDSIPSYFWLWWMPNTSFCGWMLAPMAPVLMPRSSTSVIYTLLMAPWIYLMQSHCRDDPDMPYFFIGDDAFSLRTR